MTERDAPRCLYCGALATDQHHLTGRLGRRYLDPELTIWLCKPCHGTEHRAWRLWGLDAIDDPSRARLRRLAFFDARLCHLDRPVDVPASTWAGLAACHLDLATTVRRP